MKNVYNLVVGRLEGIPIKAVLPRQNWAGLNKSSDLYLTPLKSMFQERYNHPTEKLRNGTEMDNNEVE
jgi:hypothetical protein